MVTWQLGKIHPLSHYVQPGHACNLWTRKYPLNQGQCCEHHRKQRGGLLPAFQENGIEGLWCLCRFLWRGRGVRAKREYTTQWTHDKTSEKLKTAVTALYYIFQYSTFAPCSRTVGRAIGTGIDNKKQLEHQDQPPSVMRTFYDILCASEVHAAKRMFSAAKKRANFVLTMAVRSWSRSTMSCLAQSCPTTSRCLSSCEMAEQPNNIAISRSKPGNFYFLNRVRDLGGEPNWPVFLSRSTLQNKAELPIKTRVIWVLGLYTYHYIWFQILRAHVMSCHNSQTYFTQFGAV